MSERAPKKFRRNPHSCDECRRRKIRCNSSEMPNAICSNCINMKIECKHAIVNMKRGPSLTTGLQPEKADMINDLVSQILSSTNPYVLPDEPQEIRKILVDLATHIQLLDQELSNALHKLTPRSSVSPKSQDDPEEDDDMKEVSEHFKSLNIESGATRHFGKASHLMLIQTAIQIKKEITREQASKVLARSKRRDMWNYEPWQEMVKPVRAPLFFPEPDLMDELIRLFFVHFHPFFPLLHRPTFLQSVVDGLHVKNYYFGATVLVVCALGARYTTDPRVIFPGSNTFHSAGWGWVRQIHVMSLDFYNPPSLYEVQFSILFMHFTSASSAPESIWAFCGNGIRWCQELGYHSKKKPRKTIEGELWNRAFWSLIAIDVLVSQYVGRPRATTIDDYDVDYPVECDDEYWDHPDPRLAWSQPPGRPSCMTYWVSFLKLIEIIGTSERNIFCVRQPDSAGHEHDQNDLNRLRADFKRWKEEIPEHLIWNPNLEDPVFFQQSVSLHAMYYWSQMQIHHPFIHKPGRVSTTALAEAASAGRSCTHVIDVLQKRGYLISLANTLVTICVFTAAMMQLMNAWRCRVEKRPVDLRKDLANIYRCMEFLRSVDAILPGAGRMVDVLTEMVGISELQDTSQRSKRARNADDGVSRVDWATSSILESEPRVFAGSSRIHDLEKNYPLSILNDNPLITSSPWVTDSVGYENESRHLDAFSDPAVYQHAPIYHTETSGDTVSGPSPLWWTDTESPPRQMYNDWESYMSVVDELLRHMDQYS